MNDNVHSEKRHGSSGDNHCFEIYEIMSSSFLLTALVEAIYV